MSEALLAAEPDRKLPTLLGQKLDRLTKSGTIDPSVIDAIESFKALLELRNDLVHGDGFVFVGLKGEWLLKLEVIGPAGYTLRHVSQHESDSAYQEIRRTVDVLGGRLSTVARKNECSASVDRGFCRRSP